MRADSPMPTYPPTWLLRIGSPERAALLVRTFTLYDKDYDITTLHTYTIVIT